MNSQQRSSALVGTFLVPNDAIEEVKHCTSSFHLMVLIFLLVLVICCSCTFCFVGFCGMLLVACASQSLELRIFCTITFNKRSKVASIQCSVPETHTSAPKYVRASTPTACTVHCSLFIPPPRRLPVHSMIFCKASQSASDAGATSKFARKLIGIWDGCVGEGKLN